jgi:hypothetical protein
MYFFVISMTHGVSRLRANWPVGCMLRTVHSTDWPLSPTCHTWKALPVMTQNYLWVYWNSDKIIVFPKKTLLRVYTSVSCCEIFTTYSQNYRCKLCSVVSHYCIQYFIGLLGCLSNIYLTITFCHKEAYFHVGPAVSLMLSMSKLYYNCGPNSVVKWRGLMCTNIYTLYCDRILQVKCWFVESHPTSTCQIKYG